MSSHACKDCGTQMKVYDTSHGGKFTFRKLRCRCGSGFETTESITRRLPSLAISGQGPPLVDASPLPVAGGGVGGGLPSESDPGPDSGPISTHPDQDQTRAKSKAKAIDYPAPFLVIWDETGKYGNKYKALKAWRAVGCPTWEMIQPAYGAYLLSQRPVDGYVQDLSTWLNGRGHEQEWPPARTPVRQVPQALPFAKRVEDDTKARLIAQRAKSAFGG